MTELTGRMTGWRNCTGDEWRRPRGRPQGGGRGPRVRGGRHRRRAGRSAPGPAQRGPGALAGGGPPGGHGLDGRSAPAGGGGPAARVRSLLAVGLPYYVPAERAPGSLAVARYGWGRDYHRVIDGRLRRLGRWLEERAPGVRWRPCVDSAPLLTSLGGGGGPGLDRQERQPDPPAARILAAARPSAHHPGAAPRPARRAPLRLLQPLPHGLPHRRPAGAVRGGCPPLHRLPHDREPRPGAAGADRGRHGALGGGLRPLPGRLPLERAAAAGQHRSRPAAAALAAGPTGGGGLQWSDAEWDEKLRASALRRIKPWMWRRNLAAVQRAGRPTGRQEGGRALSRDP